MSEKKEEAEEEEGGGGFVKRQMHAEFEMNALLRMKKSPRRKAGPHEEKDEGCEKLKEKENEVQNIFFLLSLKLALSTSRDRVISVSCLKKFEMIMKLGGKWKMGANLRKKK